MTTTDSALQERVSRLEGAYEHLATKEGIARLETKMVELQARVDQRLASQTRWFVGFWLTGMAFMTGVALGIGQLLQ